MSENRIRSLPSDAAFPPKSQRSPVADRWTVPGKASRRSPRLLAEGRKGAFHLLKQK